MKFLHLNFIPRSADFALLLLRLWAGASMLLLHGWGKLTNFGAYSEKFADPFGLGKSPSLALATFAEFLCALLVIAGLFTRFATLLLAITMATAFYFAHGGALSGQRSGELPFLYLGVWLALFFAGAGKYSVDAKIGAKV